MSSAGREVRLAALRPTEVAAAMARAPVAWLPMGAVEYHAPHLPFGTDSVTAERVVTDAASLVGGVVLPPSVVTMGTLHLPWSLRYDATLVEAVARSTVEQLADAGARVVVVHTGHAPLDLLHLLKRVCHEVETRRNAAGEPGFRAMALCYLELNAALGAALGTDWPVVVDHGSITETSWMLAITPELVDLDALPPDDDTPIVGIYGPHPVGRASAALGAAQLQAGATLLAERVAGLLAGDRLDPLADLRILVGRYWPEPMTVHPGPTEGGEGTGTLLLGHGGPVSRYLTALGGTIDGLPLDPARLLLRNPSPGEAGVAVRAADLGAESGFYIRRGQSATLELPEALGPGPHDVRLTIGLAGVTTTELVTTLTVD